LKFKSTVSGVGVVDEFDIQFKLDGVVDELRIVEEEFVNNGLEFVEMDGSDDGDFGELDRLRGGIVRFVVDFEGKDDNTDISLLSIDSFVVLLRGCLDKEDIKRLAAAIGPIDRQLVIELVLLSVELVGSSLEDNSSF
jgi:hypothetical protein